MIKKSWLEKADFFVMQIFILNCPYDIIFLEVGFEKEY